MGVHGKIHVSIVVATAEGLIAQLLAFHAQTRTKSSTVRVQVLFVPHRLVITLGPVQSLQWARAAPVEHLQTCCARSGPSGGKRGKEVVVSWTLVVRSNAVLNSSLVQLFQTDAHYERFSSATTGSISTDVSDLYNM